MNTSAASSTLDWSELDRRLRPGYRDFLTALQTSLAYPFVCEAYSHSMPEAIAYAKALLGGDPKHRYDTWLPHLTDALHSLDEVGITGYAEFVDRIATHEGVEDLLEDTGMPLEDFTGLIHYLRYWVLPLQRPVRELLDPGDAQSKAYVKQLKEAGVAGTLDLLERAHTREGRRALAERLDIPESDLLDLVHRADMTRLPFHSRKTISHLSNAGAGSIATLAAADPQTLIAAVLAYGATIGKDLRYGVEAGNSALIARLLPVIVEA